MLHAFVWGLLWVAAVQLTPVIFQPTDKIGFDYEIAELAEAQVIRFEKQSNTGDWSDIGIPPIAPGAPLGWNTYAFQPTAPFDVVTTIVFRACNAQACGPASAPYTFMRVSGTSGPQLFAPAHVRRIIGPTE